MYRLSSKEFPARVEPEILDKNTLAILALLRLASSMELLLIILSKHFLDISNYPLIYTTK
jgi:hypothetical protein